MSNSKKTNKPGPLVDKGSLRMLVVGCVLIAVVIVLMGFSSSQIIKQAVVKSLKTNGLVNLAQSYGSVIEGRIDRAVDSSLTLSEDTETTNWIESGEADRRAEQDVREKTKDFSQKFGYEAAFIVSNKTRHYWSFSDNRFRLLNTVSPAVQSDAWYFTAIKMKKQYEINIDYNAQLKNTYVWINVLVGDIKNPIGITGLGMNLNSVISDIVRQNRKNGSDEDLWLVNSKGIIQLATEKSEMNQSVDKLLPAAFAKRLTGQTESANFTVDEVTDAKGQLYDIAYRQIRDTDWKLVIRIPRTETTGFLVPVEWNIAFFGAGILLIVLLLFTFLFHKIADPYKRAVQLNSELEQTVAQRTCELAEKNQKIQDGIDYASTIQTAVLPSDNELSNSLKQFFLLFEPKDAVGGDFYWIKRVRSGRILIVGDCTGHGVAGALMATAVSAMLNQITERITDDPARILAELDRRIKEFMHKDSEGLVMPHGLDAAVFVLNDDATVLYAGAAIPAYLWNGRSLSEIPACSGTIDTMARKKPAVFQNQSLDRGEGYTVYVSTDGFKDQPGGPKHLPFGKTRFLKLLSQMALLPLEEQRGAFETSLLNYQGAEIRRDDITLLGFKL